MTRIFHCLAILVMLQFTSAAYGQEWQVSVQNKGTETVWAVVAYKRTVFSPSWKVMGWYKIGPQETVHVATGKEVILGFKNAKHEVLDFESDRAVIRIPEVVRKVYVHPWDRFEYALTKGISTRPDYAPLEMSYGVIAVGQLTAVGKFTLGIEYNGAPGVPLVTNSDREKAALRKVQNEAAAREAATRAEKAKMTLPRPPAAQASGVPASSHETEVALARASVDAMMEEFRSEKDPTKSKAILGRADRRVRTVVSDPRVESVEAWHLAGVWAVLRKDAELGAFAFEAIERLRPGYGSDPLLLKNMGELDAMGVRERSEKIRTERANWLAEYNKTKAGDAGAMYGLGWYYANGKGVPRNDAKAIEWWTKAAEVGDRHAMYTLGFNYDHGQREPTGDVADALKQYGKTAEWYKKARKAGDAHANMMTVKSNVRKDIAKAMEWYSKAAQAGHAGAMYNLGKRYANGEGVPKNNARAIEWWTKAAQADDADAMSDLGKMYANGEGVPKNNAKAIEWWTKAAQAGHLKAMNILGTRYTYGIGVPKDEAKAIEWLTKAAQTGDADAISELGKIYGTSKSDVPKEAARAAEWWAKKAVEWYTKAAQKGHAGAMKCLGWCYANGEGVPKDETRAIEWYTKAAHGGHTDAMVNLFQIYVLSKNESKAVEWIMKAAQAGDTEAMFSIGFYHQVGVLGMPKDDAKAIEWFTKVVKAGEAEAAREAMNKIGEILSETGLPEDATKAIEWYTKAAQGGHTGAMNNLGVMYLTGNGVPKDEAKAVEWLTKADPQTGRAGAMFKLGQLHDSYGWSRSDVSKDVAKAVEWYTKAARAGSTDAQEALRKMDKTW